MWSDLAAFLPPTVITMLIGFMGGWVAAQRTAVKAAEDRIADLKERLRASEATIARYEDKIWGQR